MNVELVRFVAMLIIAGAILRLVELHWGAHRAGARGVVVSPVDRSELQL